MLSSELLPARAICPECEAGKCQNCDGSALHPATDEIVVCECKGTEGPESGHKARALIGDAPSYEIPASAVEAQELTQADPLTAANDEITRLEGIIRDAAGEFPIARNMIAKLTESGLDL